MQHGVTSARADDGGVTVAVAPASGGEATEIRADRVLVAIGRRPVTEGLGLEALGIETDDRGFIGVDGRFETSVPGIYAGGDAVNEGPASIVKAAAAGKAIARHILGQHARRYRQAYRHCAPAARR